MILASCGTTNSNTTNGSESTIAGSKKYNHKLELKENGNATFTIKNETDEATTLTYPSGQEVEYQLIDKDKNNVFTYSANKVFILMLSEKVLQPNEETVIPIELKTELT